MGGEASALIPAINKPKIDFKSWNEHLGASLLTKDGMKPTSELLAEKKIVGIYFSAHWCPPCRGFTPILAEFYLAAKRSHNIEIVVCSSDKSAEECAKYYEEMPWAAVPYDDRELASQLSSLFKIQGIPTLVILDSDGKILNADAKSSVVVGKGNVDAIVSKWLSGNSK